MTPGDLDVMIVVASGNSVVPIVALELGEEDTGGDDATITVVGDIVGAEGVVARDEIGLTIPVTMKDAILV